MTGRGGDAEMDRAAVGPLSRASPATAKRSGDGSSIPPSGIAVFGHSLEEAYNEVSHENCHREGVPRQWKDCGYPERDEGSIDKADDEDSACPDTPNREPLNR